MDGYEVAYLFVDRQSGKAISITLWESEEAMRTGEEPARTLRDQVAGGLGTQIVDVEHYEVAIGLEELTPVIDRTFPLSEVPEAIRFLQERHAQGKVVIAV